MPKQRKELPPPLEEIVPISLFKSEVYAWAKRIGVEPKQVTLRPMKRKWASCSNGGHLTFNIELLNKPPDFRKRVIVHELLHLKIPNHGKLFKVLLEIYLSEKSDRSPAE
ncbi:MAG: M48 family metallopeptidase [bacterium]